MSDHNHITFICLRCDHRQEAVPYAEEDTAIDALCKHLEEAHGVDQEARNRVVRGAGGHVDAQEWYEWDYRLYLDTEPLARKIVRRERAVSDPMRFA
jgi:hypothetical protein